MLTAACCSQGSSILFSSWGWQELIQLTPARGMAVTSSEHLCPADEDHSHCRGVFTPPGAQWGLKGTECQWLNGNIAFDKVAWGNLCLAGQPAPAPLPASPAASHIELFKAEMCSATWIRRKNSPWCTQRCLCCLTKDQSWCLQKFCQWLWNYLHLLNDQHNCQKYQAQLSRGK